MLFQIKGRFDGLVKCEVEITAAHNASEATKLGKAVLAAISSGANLGGAYLGGAYLSGANLGGANLGGAYLGGAYLHSAYLRSANLGGADLRSANLGGAYLRSADLRSADLSGANLGGADLGGADLRSANLGGEIGKVTKGLASVSRSDGYTFHGFVRKDGSLGIAAGCQLRTLPSYVAHIAKDYPGTAKAVETQDILDFLAKRLEASK